MMPPLPSTCLSDKPHDHRVSDPVTHFNACLRASKQRYFYENLPPQSQQRILRDNARIAALRHRLETAQSNSTAGVRLKTFKSAMAQWCFVTHRPSTAYSSDPRFESTRSPGAGSCIDSDDDINRYLSAHVMYFRDGHPIDVPGIPNEFPDQKVTMSDLLSPNEAKNLLMQPCDDNVVRYFHLPANNMAWVEEVIARYYHESRPASDDMLFKSKAQRPKTKTEMLLRPEYWHGQQNFDMDSEVHARHMRPFCDGISVDPVTTERLPRNLVLFMPYLHWETDRGRLLAAEMMKEAGRQNMRSIAEIANQAHHELARMHTHDTTSPVLELHPSSDSTLVASGGKRKALGQVFRNAAALFEAMDLHDEEQLMVEYLHSQPPLHPRRTLDQSYYGALKNTGTRDRDQVVYRATTPASHDCIGPADCEQCNQDIRKVPRIIMVDQLWMWILDEQTVITSFPRRWGKNKPDPSAIHKNLRLRLKHARRGDVSSVYDLALMVVDECSRVFFDRTKANDRQPHLVELFTSAIRDLTYKQTAAFDQFLIYTHLASRDYKRERLTTADNSTQNTLLNINPEGNLLKEVKDIMDEIYIMLRIMEQQHKVMEGLVKHIRRSLVPLVRPSQPRGRPSSALWPTDEHTAGEDDFSNEIWKAKRTLDQTDHLVLDLEERISDLQGLLDNAQNTSAALKDLLTLKQQQAGVIEAREAVKQAQLTLKQGQSIMIFTIVTIIFLPLSFCVGLFGMNALELNEGLLPLSTEFKYMFPISAGIILVAFVFAFSQTVLSNSIVMLCRSAASFAYNTTLTWLLVKTGLYMAGRDMAVQANRLRDKEAKLTGAMKAEVLRKEKNLERMRAAGNVRKLTRKRSHDSEVGRTAATSVGSTSGRTTPFRPYTGGTTAPSSPFLTTHSSNHTRRGFQGKDLGISMEEVDVELGDRNRRPDLGETQRKMAFRQLV